MRRKIVPILLIVLVLFVSVVNAEGTETYVLYVLCRPTDYVNARYAPSTKSDVMGRLECGDEVETDGVVKRDKQGRSWTHIVNPGFESGESWVCSMYLQETPITIGLCYGYVSENGRTALRRSPYGKRIKWLSNGDEIIIYAMSEEWVLSKRGYVGREFLDIFTEKVYE